jgi:hypothetical protein
MKCVCQIGQGVPVRMTDAEAAELVAEGDGEYCSKGFWKTWWDTDAARHLGRQYSKEALKVMQ